MAFCPAAGKLVPPVAEIVTVPPAVGIKTVYSIEPAFAPVVVLELALVVIDTAVKLSAVVVVPANVSAEADDMMSFFFVDFSITIHSKTNTIKIIKYDQELLKQELY